MKAPEEAFFGFKTGVFLAGAVGGLVSLWFRPALSWRGAMMSIFCGAATAYYIMPLVHEYFGFSQNLEGSVAFLVGVFGMLLAGKVYQFLSGLDLPTIGEWIKVFLRRMIK